MSENDTPIEGAVPAAPEAPELKANDQEVTAEPETPEQSETRKSRAAERIAELTRNWRQAERERDYLRGQLDAIRVPEQRKVEPKSRPTLEQFNHDHVAYMEALTDWKLEQKLTEREQREQATNKKTEAEKAKAEFVKNLQVAAQKYADFNEVAFDPSLPIPDHVVNAVMELGEAAGEVLYHLGKNPTKAAEIASMSPQRAAIALGRLEASLAKPAPAPSPVPQVSKAPPPTPVVGNRASVEKDPDKMTADEWQVWRNKQIASERQALRRK